MHLAKQFPDIPSSHSTHLYGTRFLRLALAIFCILLGSEVQASDLPDANFPASGANRPVRIVRSHRLGLPVYIEATPSTSMSSNSSIARATRDPTAIPEIVSRVFKIDSPESELVLESTTIDALGFRHELFQQRHRGVPVFSGLLRLHFRDDGEFHAATGRYYPIPPDFSTIPQLDPRDAMRAVLASVDGDLRIAESELVIVDPGWYGDPSIGPHLAYRLTAVSQSGVGVFGAFVDANTGQLIDQWSSICTANERRVYDGTGQTTLPGVLARDEGAVSTGVEDIDEAYNYVGDAIAFFQNAFGRNGIDDAGGETIVTVDANDIGVIFCPNASYDFARRQLIFCAGATADDVVAHEWTHGVTSSTANLIYQNQSGQLNESFSDVFGELVDLYNGGAELPGMPNGTPWLAHESGSGVDSPNGRRTAGCSFAPGLADGVRWVMGEDAITMNGPFRDMWNPGCFQSPSYANDTLQTCSLLDNGGVHSGSGIPNHAFAILCDGKTYNNITVNAIGPAKAAAVWYRALTTYLTVGSDFQDAFLAFNLAASDLVGTMPNDPRNGLPTGEAFTSGDAIEVEKALLAVEMDTPGACGETVPTLDPMDPPFCEQSDVVYSDDFESGNAGWTVSNSAPPTPYDWQLVGSLPFSRPGTAWFIEDRNVGDCDLVSESAVHELMSPVIQTPFDFETLTLDFVHFLEVEPRFDGGVVELQINGGAWRDIPQSTYRHNGNNISLYQGSQGNLNPLAGRLAFSGVGGTWGRSVVELASIVSPGDAIRLRFRFGKDDCYGLTGWWVDDVRITVCRSSGDCNMNAVPDEIDRAAGPAPELLLNQPINLLALANLSDLDPHPTLGPHKVVEDFTLLRPTHLTTVRVHGGYDDDVETPDDFTIELFEDDDGLPGSLIASYPSVASTRHATGEIFYTNNEYAYELSLPAPLSLPPGDYMIGVYNNTTASAGTWRWGRAWFGWTPGAAFFGQGCDWCRFNTANFAIEVVGDTVGRAPGDLNADSVRDLQDLNTFVSVLLIGSLNADQRCAADMNADGAVDGLDVELFASCLLTTQCDD